MTEIVAAARNHTHSTILLMSAIGNSFRTLEKYGFINAYLDDKHHEVHYEDSLYLLFRPDSMERFEVHVKREQKEPNFVTQYDYEGGYIVLVYNILDEWKKDYEIIKNSKYSKVSQAYKDTYPRTKRLQEGNGEAKTQPTLQYLVFERAEGLRLWWADRLKTPVREIPKDSELYDAFDLTKEVLDIEQFKKPVKIIVL